MLLTFMLIDVFDQYVLKFNDNSSKLEVPARNPPSSGVPVKLLYLHYFTYVYRTRLYLLFPGFIFHKNMHIEIFYLTCFQ